jgi:IS1 family transposase
MEFTPRLTVGRGAVRKHTDCTWVLLYIERWLTAPVQLDNGTLEPRERGTPQGSVISPLLANLFLHYAFDRWMAKHHPEIPFERFADDAVCHCSSERQAQKLQTDLERRFAECGLTLHPDKTQIVYCKDNVRRGHYPNRKFDFLGYTFRPRLAMNRWGKTFVNFSPGISNRAAKAIRQTMRDWQLDRRIDKRINDLAKMFNPILRGWMNYYGRYHKSALSRALMHLDLRLARWAMSKYRRLRRHRRRARYWVQDVRRREPALFAHWLDGRSPMSGDAHVRICESLGVKFPRATRLVIAIAGKKCWLWRAVDQDGYVLDEIVQNRRNTKAARRLLTRLLKKQGMAPKRMITDKLRSYVAASRQIMPTLEHRSHKGLNNRADFPQRIKQSSGELASPLRKRERVMQTFRSSGSLQRFLSAFSAIRNLFVPPRTRRTALAIHLHRISALAHWKSITSVTA